MRIFHRKYNLFFAVNLLFFTSLFHPDHLSAAPSAGDETTSGQPGAQNGLWEHYSLFSIVRALAFDDQTRTLWVGTSNGLLRYNLSTGKQHAYTTKSGLLSNIVHTLQIAPNGDVWVGTIGGGLSRLRGEQWQTYTPYGAGSTVSYGKHWQAYPIGKGLGDLWVYDIHFDPAGTMWVATWKGVSRFDGKAFRTYTTEDGLVDKWVYTLSQDKKGAFWFGTEAGVSRFDGKTWRSWDNKDGVGANIKMTVPPVAQGLPSTPRHHAGDHKPLSYNPNYIVSSTIDSNDHLWVGTLGAGLSHFDGEKWTSYSKQDGLAGNMVHALKFDAKGILWIGTDGGVSRFDGKIFSNLTKKDGIGGVFSIEIDHQGHKWFGSFGGVSQYRGK
ncbi:MAG: two-component regulator propeller domain-containing protein [Nitrospiria bacterium]